MDDDKPADFAMFGEKACAAMIQAAEMALQQAQKQLEETQTQAEQIMATIRERQQTIVELNERHRALGKAILAAARECIQSNGKGVRE
jgi:peptidoglycan hydrolase CwlO-like protein